VASDSFEPGRAARPGERTVRQSAKGSDYHPTSELPEVETGTGWPEADEDADRRPASRRDEYDEDAPRRWGRPSGCLFWLAGMVALIVVVGLGLKVTGLLPHFHNPFAEKTTDRSQPTLLLSIQDLARFEAASGNFQEVIDVQKDRSFIPDIIFNDRALFVCVGSVDAYVDFSHIAQGDITDSADHKTVTIKLPAPQLEKPNIDHGKSYIFAAQKGIVNKIGDLFGGNPNKEQELYLLGEQRIAQAARDSGLTERAATNTKQMLTGMLKGLGYTSITINVASP
jgi:hypothetical protein